MLVQAKSKIWDKKLKSCKTEANKNSLIINSGKISVSTRLDLETLEEFYRPVIGKYIIYDENDTMKYTTVEAAIKKAEELRKELKTEISIFYQKQNNHGKTI